MEENNNVTPQNQGGKGKAFSITSMVTGIVAVCTCCLWYVALPLGAVALVFGIISLVKKYDGKGMALAGVITGGAALVLMVLVIALLMFGVFTSYAFDSFRYYY